MQEEERQAPGDVPEKQPLLHIGRLLRDHIARKKLNQAKVARSAFITPQALSGMLNRSSIQLETLARLCVAMDHDFFKDISDRLYGRPEVEDQMMVEPIGPYERGAEGITITVRASAQELERVTRFLEQIDRLKGEPT